MERSAEENLVHRSLSQLSYITLSSTYIAGHLFILLHQPLVVLVNLQHFTDSVRRRLRLHTRDIIADRTERTDECR